MQREKDITHALIGNSFPFNLIDRCATITVVEREEFLQQSRGCALHSFWGHANTLEAVERFTGMELTPAVARPVLTLSEQNLPVLDNREFDLCWIVSPIYACSLRPKIGEEVKVDQISGWRIKKIEWNVCAETQQRNRKDDYAGN